VIEGRRNEVLDCSNYSRGVASMRGWDRWRDARFHEMERLLKLEDQIETTSVEQPKVQNVARPRSLSDLSRLLNG
jgi:hypothetical protein